MRMISKNVNFYNKNGYIKIKVFNHNDIKNFENLIKKKIDRYLKNKNWNLLDYHNHIDKENNNKITNTLRRYINIDKKLLIK